MIRQQSRRLWLLLYAIAAALVLTGCGGGSSGGGGGGGGGGGDSASVSGTAAAGAPLVGFVGARDMMGNEATAQIGEGGGFNLDLTELDPPVLLFASGISGGNAYQLLSVVLDDDVNGTVNITPLTDLIVGNALGKDPVTAFNESGGDENERAALFSAIDAQGIEDQTNLLATRLKPLLDAVGVEEDFDLRKTPFTANREGFDAVLDVIQVEVDVTNDSATIRNRLDPASEITNTFDPTDEETQTLEVDETTVTNGVSTLQNVDDTLNSVITAISSGEEGDLTPLLANNFLYNGTSATDFFESVTTGNSDRLVSGLESWSLVEIDDTTNPTTIRVNVGDPNGNWELQQTEDDLLVSGNLAPFFAETEIIHNLISGASSVNSVNLNFRASNPDPELPTANPVVNGPGVTDLPLTNTGTDVFEASATLSGPDISLLESGSAYTISWDGGQDNVASYRVRRGSPNLSNGAPEITGFDADYIAGEFQYAWTLPVGYEPRDAQNDFDDGLSDISLESTTESVSGILPRTFSPSEGNTAALIAEDNFGVLVEVSLENAFANVAPASEPDTLTGSYVVRNTDRADNAPYIHFTFFDSGAYIHLELGDDFRPEPDPNGETGMEVGSYTWDNVTGAFEFTAQRIDQNGEWGASNNAPADLPIKAVTSSTGLTLDFASGSVLQLDRVPANGETGGVAGTWATQLSESEVQVLTLLEDGFYFIGDAYNESGEEVPGLEFGRWSWDSETLILDYTTEYDQNGVAGLADNGAFNGDYIFTVIKGQLVADQDGATELTELVSGNPVGNGDLTVDYTPPGTDPTGPEVAGNFHYLRNVSFIEGQREAAPPSIGQLTYSYTDTTITDDNGTGTISWTQACFADLLVDANTTPTQGDAVFDPANECLSPIDEAIDGFAYTQSGLSAELPEETVIDQEDQSQIQFGSASLDLIAVDADRSLFIGQSVRDFGFEETLGFTDGVEISAHVLSEKSTGRTVADLEGTWGSVGRSILDIDGPNDLSYEATSQILDVDSQGAVRRVSRLDRRIVQDLRSDAFLLSSIEIEQEETNPETIGSFSITDDGILELGDGALGGFLSADGNVLFANVMNPFTPQTPAISDSQWLAMVRMSDSFSATDLDGKEYEIIAQSFWIQPGFFEVDYLEPGATLNFTATNGLAQLTREITYPYVPFENDAPLQREGSDPLETIDLNYSVSPEGRITLSTDFGETETWFELNGFATPDARLLVMETTLTTTSGEGTNEGGIGIAYAICTNCD